MTQMTIGEALKLTQDNGVPIGGYTLRLTLEDTRARNPESALYEELDKLFVRAFDECQFTVIEVPGDSNDARLFGVFDGMKVCDTAEIEQHAGDFDLDLHSILDGVDEPRPEPGLNIGFLSEAQHKCDADCEHDHDEAE
jgi:hypothetical protein